jgi:hypothetical protein
MKYENMDWHEYILMQSAIYYDTRIFRERVKTSWGRDSMLLKDLLGSRHHHRIYMNKQNNLKRGFQCLFGLTRRVGAIERLIQTFDAK